MKIEFEVQGLAELEKSLLTLQANAMARVMRGALLYALTPVLRAARAKAPTRRLRAALRKRSLVTKRDGYQATAGVDINTKGRKNRKDDPKNGWMWHFFEFGTAGRRQKKTKRYTGRINAQPFLRPAMDEQRESVIERFRARLGHNIDKANPPDLSGSGLSGE